MGGPSIQRPGGGGGGVKQVILYGGNLNSTTDLLEVNGQGDEATGNAFDARTRAGVVAGTIATLIIHSTGNLSSNNGTFKIHKNGSVVKTLTAVSGANDTDVFEGIAVSVADGDELVLEFDAGSTNPGNSTATLIIE